MTPEEADRAIAQLQEDVRELFFLVRDGELRARRAKKIVIPAHVL